MTYDRTCKVFGARVAPLGAVALMLPLILAVTETSARPAGTGTRGAVAAAHAPTGPAGRFHHRNSWVIWPGGGGFFYDPFASEPFAGVAQPLSSDVRYTTVYDVPWDWAHRYPPNVVPSDRPYVPSCPSETVTVPGRGGTEHTVNVMRCY
jgi:hypothetical protein